MTIASQRTILSLFTGAGGLDLGLEAAGFSTRVAVEMDGDSARTLRRNRDWPVIDRDIHTVASEEMLDWAGLREGDVDLLVGGPPCQPFSKSGYWAHGDARRLSDPRATTLEAYLRVLRDVKPRAFLLENVAGLAYQGKSEGLDLLLRTIDGINRESGTRYAVSYQLLDASQYGVPQDRERVFLVGQRDGGRFVFPAPTHVAAGAVGTEALALAGGIRRDVDLEPCRTAWDAIGDLESDDDARLRMGGKWADLLPSIPEGHNYLFHTDRGGGLPLFGWRRRYWSFLLKLEKRRPAWTITAQPGSAIGPFHWRSRRLSMRELCRLQTFPDNFEITGSLMAVQRQVGNAVPSALAERMGLCIRRQLFGDHVDERRPLTLAPARREPIPLPVSPEAVPRKYLDLVGAHSAHPGTGRGHRAAARERPDDTYGVFALA